MTSPNIRDLELKSSLLELNRSAIARVHSPNMSNEDARQTIVRNAVTFMSWLPQATQTQDTRGRAHCIFPNGLSIIWDSVPAHPLVTDRRIYCRVLTKEGDAYSLDSSDELYLWLDRYF